MIKTLEKEMNLNFFNSFPVDANVFFGIINLDLTTYFWSDNFIEFLGWEFDEIKDNFKFIHQDDLSLIRHQLHKLIEGAEQPVSLDARFVTKSESIIWMNISFSSYRFSDSLKISAIAKKINIEKEQSVAELKQLIDTANAPIFGIDINGNVNEWNQKAAQITGFSKDDVVGNHFVETYITDEYKESVKNVLDQALGGIETSNYEVPVFTKNGDRVMVLLNATTRRNVQGDIIGVVGVGQDITIIDKVRAENTLIATELTQLIDTANAPIFGIDINGNVNEWNQKAAEITGFSKDDVVGNHFVETYITDEYKESVKDVLDQALNGNETSNYEVPVFTKNGDRVMVLLNATTRRNVQGDIIGVVGVGQDITEIDNLRRDLTISNTRWQSMIKNENISINEVNLDLEITFCSNILKSVKGFFTKEQIVGTSIYKLNPDPNWKKQILPKIERLRNFGEYFTDESKFNVEGKTCTIQNQWLPVYEGSIIVSFVIISSDISEKKELEEKSKLLQEKRESLSQQLLSIQEDERKRVARYVHDEIGQQLASLKISLESQNNSISRSLDQIQGLIGTSRKIAKELRPAQLDLLGLKDAIQTLISDSKSNSDILFTHVIDLPANVSQKLSDTIYRVVQEGIENSVKHSQATSIEIDIKEINSKIEIIIQDNGIGIEDKDFNKEGSFGLIGIEERLVPFDGDFSIKNTSPGTRLEIRIQDE